MSAGSHNRDQLRNQLLPFFEALIDTVYEARQTGAEMEAEDVIANIGDALSAQAIGQWLMSFDMDDELITIDEKVYYRLKDRVEKTYCTSRGSVRIERHVYRPRGEHNGAIACPVELRIGMVQGQWTPRCATAMAYVAQELPERNAARVASKLGAMNYSASSFKRVTRLLGECWEADREKFEEAVIKQIDIPETACRLAIAIDRVSLLMVEEGKLQWRMAYCGTLTLYDSNTEPIKTLRYGRMPLEGAHILREQMLWDVKGLLAKRPDLELVCLSDGAAELCSILDEDYPDAVRYIDFFHVVEKLAGAVKAFANYRRIKPGADEVLANWRFRLLNEDGAIDAIEATIKRWNAAHLEVGGRKPVHDALTYIANHREQMRYAQARRKGHPIGSGHVEACCKQLVSSRMKRSGQRWKATGGQAILTLRSLATDARWDAATNVLMPTLKRAVVPLNHAA